MSSADTRPGIKQFRKDGCLSYLFFDRQTRDAVVIDPIVDLVDDYREYISANQLRVNVALDTHLHADHFSATHLFKNEYQSAIGMSHASRSKRVTLPLSEGDTITAGAYALRVLETPGHASDAVCFCSDKIVFTGDTLLVGSTGRTDFPGADPAQEWESIQRLAKLPNDTVIFPAHDYSELIFSVIEIEIKKNAHLSMGSKQDFISSKLAEQIPMVKSDVQRCIQFNIDEMPSAEMTQDRFGCAACGVSIEGSDRCATINVEKYSNKLKEVGSQDVFLDVREREEFERGHIPGTRNMPLSELGMIFGELGTARRIYLSCLSGRRSALAAKTLSYLGFPDVVNVSGGYKAWVQAGLPVEK